MTDREKKIAEIEEALAKATPGDLGNFDENRITLTHPNIINTKTVAEVHDETYMPLFLNAPTWLRTLIAKLAERDAEIERLRECTPDKPCYEHLEMDRDGWKLIAEEARAEIERLRAALEEALEALEWIRDAGTDYQSISKARQAIQSIRGGADHG